MSNYFKVKCEEPEDYMTYLRTIIEHMQVINKTRDPEKEELVSVSFYLQEFSYEGVRVQDVCKLLKEYDIICQFYFSEEINTIDKTYSVHDIENKDISNCLFTIRCRAYKHDRYYNLFYYCAIEEISDEDRERIENADLDDIKADDDVTIVDCDSEDDDVDIDYDKSIESVYALKLDKLYCHTDEGYNILLDMLDDDICDAKSALAPKLINENRTYYLVYLMRYYARIKSYLNEDSSLYSCTIKIDDNIHLTQEAFNDFKTVMDSIGMEYIPMDFNSLDFDFDLRYTLTVFYTGHETDKYMWTIQVIH